LRFFAPQVPEVIQQQLDYLITDNEQPAPQPAPEVPPESPPTQTPPGKPPAPIKRVQIREQLIKPQLWTDPVAASPYVVDVTSPSATQTLDAVVYQWYAALLAAISAGIGLGRLRQENKERRRGPPQRTSAGMEAAQATATAPPSTPGTQATLRHTARGTRFSTHRSPFHSNHGPTNQRAQNRKNPGDALSPFLKKQNRLIILFFFTIGHVTPYPSNISFRQFGPDYYV